MEASTPLVCLRRILEILGKIHEEIIDQNLCNVKLINESEAIKIFQYS